MATLRIAGNPLPLLFIWNILTHQSPFFRFAIKAMKPGQVNHEALKTPSRYGDHTPIIKNPRMTGALLRSEAKKLG